jgi:pseudouridine synthase
MRLARALARAGLGARRKCEEAVREGRVTVDGEVITDLSATVDPQTQDVRCDGVRLRLPRTVVLAFHKPRGVLSVMHPHPKERTIFQYVDSRGYRLFPVGRLDRDSEGLLLLTNDGELCNMLAHPRHQVPRTYHVVLRGLVEGRALEKLRRGVWLAEGRTGPILARIKKRARDVTVADVTVREGMNREIRRAFARVGVKVLRLKRIAIGPLSLGRLRAGAVRELTPKEVEALRRCARGTS